MQVDPTNKPKEGPPKRTIKKRKKVFITEGFLKENLKENE